MYAIHCSCVYDSKMSPPLSTNNLHYIGEVPYHIHTAPWGQTYKRSCMAWTLTNDINWLVSTSVLQGKKVIECDI